MKKTVWLVIETTIGSQVENGNIVDVLFTFDEAKEQAEHIELNDNAIKCYIVQHEIICNGTGELSEVKPKAKVKFIGRDSAYEGKYNYLKDCLVNDEIAQLENISARLKKDGHKYLVINTIGGEFIWTVK